MNLSAALREVNEIITINEKVDLICIMIQSDVAYLDIIRTQARNQIAKNRKLGQRFAHRTTIYTIAYDFAVHIQAQANSNRGCYKNIGSASCSPGN